MGALQDAATPTADRIGQRRIAERELVVAVRVILLLARIATGRANCQLTQVRRDPATTGKMPSNT
jgi:hypothetical protein